MSSFKEHYSGYNLRSRSSTDLVVPGAPAKDRPDFFSRIPEPNKKRACKRIDFSSQLCPVRSNSPNDQSEIRSYNDLQNENILLREELVAVHKASAQEHKRMMLSQDRAIRCHIDREIHASESHRSEIISYREAEHYLKADISDLREEVDNLSSELQVTDRELRDTATILTDHLVFEEEWIGRTLKFQYLFQQIEKIGLKQSEDIFDAFQDIEVPEVSINIKDKFVPTSQTDNIDWSDIKDIDLQEDIEWQDNIEWQGDYDWHEPDIIGEDQIVPSIPEPIGGWDNNGGWGGLGRRQGYIYDYMEDMSEILTSLFNEE